MRKDDRTPPEQLRDNRQSASEDLSLGDRRPMIWKGSAERSNTTDNWLIMDVDAVHMRS